MKIFWKCMTMILPVAVSHHLSDANFSLKHSPLIEAPMHCTHILASRERVHPEQWDFRIFFYNVCHYDGTSCIHAEALTRTLILLSKLLGTPVLNPDPIVVGAVQTEQKGCPCPQEFTI